MGKGVILETERLILREFEVEDTDDLFEVLGDPLAMLFYPAPFSRTEVEDWIWRNRARYDDVGFGMWAMLRKHSGELIGDSGCFMRELDGDMQCELGWHVRREFWGNGYASEAAQHCIDYAFSRLGMTQVVALIRPENRSSCRVAEKNGMTCERLIFWRGYDHSVYVKQR